MFKLSFLSTLFLSLLLSSCFSDKGVDGKTKNCSVAPRCENQSDLAIRLRQVETLYYEQETDETTSFIDLAQFDYNELNQWTGGVTRRVAESDFDYFIEYNVDGKMSQSIKTYYDDLDNTASVELEYFYNDNELDRSESSTEIRDEDNLLLKTIDETFEYTFVGGKLQIIDFSVDDSDLGISSFSYEFTYENNRIKNILVTQQIPAKPDYIFKTFSYNEEGNVSSSISYRLNLSNEQVEQETTTYEYFIDGPIKLKTALTNSTPKQKIETYYKWEAGGCATNQTFGDRLFPTPEVLNFPCF